MTARGPRLLDTRPLRSSRPFRDLWIGTALASLGQQIANVAVLQQTWELTRSPIWTGAVGVAVAVPMLTSGLLGGALADAVDRRALVRATTIGQVVVAAALAAQAVAGNGSVVVLLVLVALHATASALGAPARRTFPVRLLPTDQVAAGLALSNVTFQASMLVGPALAGAVLAEWRYPAAYGLQAVATLGALVAVTRLPPMPVVRASIGGGQAPDPVAERGSAPGAWRFVLRRRALRGSFLTDLAACTLAMPVALFPVVNEVRFGGDPRTLGLFLSAVALGGIAAGVFSGAVTGLRRSGAVQLAAACVWGLALAGFGLATPLWLALGCLAVAGAADSVSVFTRGALVQWETPDGYRGRVSSVEHVIGVAGPEIGNFRAGLVAAATSATTALVTGGLAVVVVVGAVAATHRELRRYVPPGRSERRSSTGP